MHSFSKANKKTKKRKMSPLALAKRSPKNKKKKAKRNQTSSQPNESQELSEYRPRSQPNESQELSSESPGRPQLSSESHSTSHHAMSHTLTSAANLANLLPTGTLLAFQLLMPVFTSNGSCDDHTRILTAGLLALLSLSCFLSSFTDSVKAHDGKVYYGLATINGMWVFDYPDHDPEPYGSGLPDLRKYRMRFVDWIHAALSVLVFGAVALRDKYAVSCFYPAPEQGFQKVLDVIPMGVGVIGGMLFLVFPARRRGIGYPGPRRGGGDGSRSDIRYGDGGRREIRYMSRKK